MTADHPAPGFAELIAPYRRELLVHCYRLLGSMDDAEDVLQEVLLAAWRGLPGFEGRSSLRVWLYRIATNRCLNAVRRRPPVPVPPFEPPAPSAWLDATWLQPLPGPAAEHERAETVALAFVAMLQTMPPRQAAALVLHDVLGFGPAETADLLGTGVTAVKGLLQRARARAAEVPDPDSGATDEVARAFAERFAADDVDGVVALLTDDVWLAMPPAPHMYLGRAAVAEFLRVSAVGRPDRYVLTPATANGQPAFGCHLDGEWTGLIVLTVAGDRVAGLTRFLYLPRPERYGLPG